MNEKLYEGLVVEYERLVEILDQLEVNSEEWKETHDRLLLVIDKMNTFNKTETEYYVKSEERELQKTLEKEKQKITWQRVGFEMSKIILPLLITVGVRTIERHEMYDFEEHGRLTSTAGRQFRFMDLFRKN